jgi:two-component system cell cycle sensor histidine kinase/response regulator CckA
MTQHTDGTILLVEDEPNFRSVLSQMLRRQGYTVVTANNGALAWEQLRTQAYDVILCDILMPEISGPALYR